MRTYSEELARRLPSAAPDLDFYFYPDTFDINFTEQVLIPWDALSKKRSLVHFTTTFASVAIACPYVVTVHDLIFLRFPLLLRPVTLRLFTWMAKWVVPRAARVIVDDERTIDDCERLLGVSRERCRVVPLGYDDELLKTKGLERLAGRPYLLYSGNRSAHKNVDRLIKAWEMLPPSIEVDLVITGPGHPEGVDMRSGTNGRTLVYAGNVPREQLWGLYGSALAYVHPALTEGFGIPMLEAMVLGTPVIASEQCVPLVLRDHATTFAAENERQLAAILESVCRSPEGFRSKAQEAAAWARRFTWDRCAAETAAVYRELI